MFGRRFRSQKHSPTLRHLGVDDLGAGVAVVVVVAVDDEPNASIVRVHVFESVLRGKKSLCYLINRRALGIRELFLTYALNKQSDRWLCSLLTDSESVVSNIY